MHTDLVPTLSLNLVPRADAVEALGICYSHHGSWRDPVIEHLGLDTQNADPLVPRKLFANELEAIEHVVGLAKSDAEQRSLQLRESLDSPVIKLRLWLARNWDEARRRENGLLATHAIVTSNLEECQRILKEGAPVRVRRLPDILSLPAILIVGTPVWVFDKASFPEREPSVRQDTIASVQFFEAGADPAFDLVVRYRLNSAGGLFAYDHADRQSEYLTSGSADVRACLTEACAERDLALFAHQVRGMLDRAGAVPLLPPPTSLQEAPELLPYVVEATAADAAPPEGVPEETPMLKKTTTVIGRIFDRLTGHPGSVKAETPVAPALAAPTADPTPDELTLFLASDNVRLIRPRHSSAEVGDLIDLALKGRRPQP